MEKTGKKPNIIMILADDQGPWAMHCAGTPELYTPNLDRIAEQGMRFDSFFCASPVCSPARASILTGKMPSAHGVQDWLRSGNLDGEKFAAQGKENPYFEGYKQERKPISYLEGQPTYTDILAQNGYDVYNFAGGYMTYAALKNHEYELKECLGCGMEKR